MEATLAGVFCIFAAPRNGAVRTWLEKIAIDASEREWSEARAEGSFVLLTDGTQYVLLELEDGIVYESGVSFSKKQQLYSIKNPVTSKSLTFVNRHDTSGALTGEFRQINLTLDHFQKLCEQPLAGGSMTKDR